LAPTDKDLDRVEARVEATERTLVAIQVKSAEEAASTRAALSTLTCKVDQVSAKLDAGVHVPAKLLPWVVLVLGASGLMGPGVAELARGAFSAGLEHVAPVAPASDGP
jgi:hypothetical protein